MSTHFEHRPCADVPVGAWLMHHGVPVELVDDKPVRSAATVKQRVLIVRTLDGVESEHAVSVRRTLTVVVP